MLQKCLLSCSGLAISDTDDNHHYILLPVQLWRILYRQHLILTLLFFSFRYYRIHLVPHGWPLLCRIIWKRIIYNCHITTIMMLLILCLGHNLYGDVYHFICAGRGNYAHLYIRCHVWWIHDHWWLWLRWLLFCICEYLSMLFLMLFSAIDNLFKGLEG